MSIRTWQAQPTARIELESGVYPVVTQEDLIKAVVDGCVLVDRAGGVLMVGVQRVPTGIPNEYVTIGALVTWQDRTNAKAQAEPSALEVADPLAQAVEQGASLHPGQTPDLSGEYEIAVETGSTAPPAPAPAEPPATPAAAEAGRGLTDQGVGDGLSVDPFEVDESDPSLQGLRG